MTGAADDDGETAAVLAKMLAMAFLGVSSFVVGSTPVCVFERLGIRRKARGAANAVLRLVLNFGGGVLLCTTFLHLLPEVREGVERLSDDGTLNKSWPVNELLAELIMCAGFLFMFSIEELVHGVAAGDCGHAHHDEPDYDHHHRHRPAAASDKGAKHDQQQPPGACNNNGFGKEGQQVAAAVGAGRMVNYNSCTSVAELEMVAVKDPARLEQSSSSMLRGFLVIGALSIHELFEGLAVGLEKNAAQVWSLTVAVACHKLVIAFYVGLQMLSDRTKPLLAHCSILLFAVTSPAGIGVGALVSNLDETHTVLVLSVVLQGLATGTLMYVVFFEVLKPSDARLSIQQRLLRLAFIAIGFASMLSIQLLISE